MRCRICNSKDLRNFLSLGKTPLANSFLLEKELNLEEKKFPLEACFCMDCKLVQLNYIVPAELMFKNYIYVSSTTNTFKVHFAKMAEEISREFKLNEKSLAVDIGSNDGLLLKGFQKFGVKTFGVEPAANLADIARKNGVDTINDFFNESAAKEIISKKANADVITATNVFAHVDNISDLIRNVKFLLKENGIFVIEVPYLVDMLEKMTFDAIYHEHLSYFSVIPLAKFFKMNGMEIFKIKKVDSHGGSLRVFAKKKEGKFEIDESVSMMIENEKKIGIEDFETYKKFADKVYAVKKKLIHYLKDIKSKGKIVAAYGAPAKGNTLLNFCGIGNDYIDYIVEDNPLKQGLYAPGSHIIVLGPNALDEKKPDYILILAWNFAEEILNKTKKYKDMGIKFIIPLPEPVVV